MFGYFDETLSLVFDRSQQLQYSRNLHSELLRTTSEVRIVLRSLSRLIERAHYRSRCILRLEPIPTKEAVIFIINWWWTFLLSVFSGTLSTLRKLDRETNAQFSLEIMATDGGGKVCSTINSYSFFLFRREVVVIHHRKKDGGCTFYQLISHKESQTFSIFVPVLRTFCNLGLEIYKSSVRFCKRC